MHLITPSGRHKTLNMKRFVCMTGIVVHALLSQEKQLFIEQQLQRRGKSETLGMLIFSLYCLFIVFC